MSDLWDDNEFPLGYLITVRTFGTWLHGDERGSLDRHGKNLYGAPLIGQNANLRQLMDDEMGSKPFILDHRQILVVDREIRDVCSRRDYLLRALNVRTNHFHAVVSAQKKPELIANAFKSNATRALREQNLVSPDRIVWSRGRSRRYLWKPNQLSGAIDYTLNRQGVDLLLSFDAWVDKYVGPLMANPKSSEAGERAGFETVSHFKNLESVPRLTHSLPVVFPPLGNHSRSLPQQNL